MTPAQHKFINETLPALGYTWFLQSYAYGNNGSKKKSFIRCKEFADGDSFHCPVSAGGRAIDETIGQCEVSHPGMLLGLTYEESDQIAEAADEAGGYDPEIRTALLSATGLA